MPDHRLLFDHAANPTRVLNDGDLLPAIRTIICDMIADTAVLTPDRNVILPLVTKATLNVSYDGAIRRLNSRTLTMCMLDTLARDKTSITILIAPPAEFAHDAPPIANVPLSAADIAAAVAGAIPAPLSAVELAQALAAAFAAIPSTQAPPTPPVVPHQAVLPNHDPIALPVMPPSIDLTLFNVNDLTADVRLRYDAKLRGDPLIGSTLRTRYAHGLRYATCGPQRIITADGTLFVLKGIDDRNFFRDYVVCRSDTFAGYRQWMHALVTFAMGHGVYVHPPFCYQANHGGLHGFTAGNGQDDDLPSYMNQHLPKMSSMLFQLFNKPSMFPDGSSVIDLLHVHYGDGYAILKQIATKVLPVFYERPYTLIEDYPRQAGKSFPEYYQLFQDFIHLRALIADNPSSLANSHEVDIFISRSDYPTFLARMSYDDRRDPTKTSQFQGPQLLETLQRYLQAPHSPALQRFRPASPALPRSRPSSPAAALGTPTRSAFRTRFPNHNATGTSGSPPVTTSIAPVQQDLLNDHASDLNASDEYHKLFADLFAVALPDDPAQRQLFLEYQASVHKISQDPNVARQQPCVVCSGQHRFDSCPVLNDSEFLKKHYIIFKQFLNRVARSEAQSFPPSSSEPVHALTVAPPDDFLSADNTIDEPLDFQQGLNVPYPTTIPHSDVMSSPPHLDNPDAPRAQIDTGAFISCTNLLHLLHRYRPFTSQFRCPVRLLPATEGSDAVPHGFGYLHVPCRHAPSGYLAIRTFYHPSLRTTVIDERDIIRAYGYSVKDFKTELFTKHHDQGTFTLRCHHRLRTTDDVYFDGILLHAKCYTHALIPPDLPADHPLATPVTSSDKMLLHDPTFASDCERATVFQIYSWQEKEYARLRSDLDRIPEPYQTLPFHEYIAANTPIAAIRAQTQRLLWHQRLGHPSNHYLVNAHKYVKGIPVFQHADPVLDTCPTCIRSKQVKASSAGNTTRTATVPYQGLSVDFSFSGQLSSDPGRADDYLGINGETCWILVTDHVTRMQHGDTRLSKASPIHWLDHFLSEHKPSCRGKYVFLDQGGELYHNPAVLSVFAKHGYTVCPTGADASNQNGPVERAHLTIANAIRAMLIGANLSVKFWPYAFHHWLRITNSLPSRDQHQSPLALATGTQDDFSDFRTFGCRVWVRSPGRRQAKFKSASRKGIFLGFLPNTTRNILWYDVASDRVKIAKHVRFDEGMNDLPTDQIPPNVIHLQRTQNGDPLPSEPSECSVSTFYFRNSPFAATLTLDVPVKCRGRTLGFQLARDELNNRVYIRDIVSKSSAAQLHSSLKAAKNTLRGAYITSVGEHTVFTVDDATAAFASCLATSPPSVSLTLAPERYLGGNTFHRALREFNLFQPDHPDQLDNFAPDFSAEDILFITSVLYPDLDFSDDFACLDALRLGVFAMSSTSLTPEEMALGKLTRRKLKTLSNWLEWRRGEHRQLDHFHALRMYGPPCRRPKHAIVLRQHWNYSVKKDGERRSRNCCDGSKKAAPALHGYASTYSSCAMQPIQRMFIALAAALCYLIYKADAKDAYAHSPPPGVPTYVEIDDAYADWYKDRFGIDLDRSLVLPVNHALQGHPESGKLWEAHISTILHALGFISTTHDRTIYSAVWNGTPVLLLRQVDDFALACPSESIAKDIFAAIGTRLQLPTEPQVPFKYEGLLRVFNGVNINQFDSCIEISAKDYIGRVMQTHGWMTPSTHPTTVPQSPIPADSIPLIYENIGPPESSPDHAALETKHGFKFRSLLGELLYTYVTCRPDVGYALVTLSKFAAYPHDVHFTLLKDIARYLRETSDWGIVFHKPAPTPSLPVIPRTFLAPDPSLPPFPAATDPTSLQCFVDAAHANDLKTRRSTTGYVFMLCGGAISYRCTTQSITATSSTEAEFLAAVTAAKHARYLRSVLAELGFPQSGPTPIYEDNMSTINMINSKKPTERARHVDIQYFAIQEWKEHGDITMRYISGVLNNADDLTKPLGWVLHSRHARRSMGHSLPSYSVSSSAKFTFNQNIPSFDQGRVSAGGLSTSKTPSVPSLDVTAPEDTMNDFLNKIVE
ncbi:hypothetical protein FisN_21Lu161 [Fistulifera solaris]|uniref:Uncharacterized protein n=1 Tax=Fistulifera solaris TaxID=1519565 RepID=A0A1Z5J8W6_FISSO|nr:hypothetical protein FisN_21Lu161 [Fistulifera solaris]|eukprot:GAX10430.1 hypothetical protein FisN_21Lu161 [Fistulifera solaris]